MSWFTFDFGAFAFAFLSVLFEGLPFLLLGSLISGLVDVFVSSERLARMMPRRSAGGILLGGLLGLVFPMCECGSVIVIRRFIRKGLPLSYAVAYMLGAPIVSPIVAFSTFAAFKGANAWEMTSLRLLLGYAVAVAAGFVVSRLSGKSILQPRLLADLPGQRSGLRFAAAPMAMAGSPGPAVEEFPAAQAEASATAADQGPDRDFADVATDAPLGRKLLLAIRSATADFLDVTFFFVIGVALTSVFNTGIQQSAMDPLATQPIVAIVSLMGLAALLALCSTTDAFVAATFTAFPLSAKLAFITFGPVFDLKLFWLYGIIFRRRFVVLLSLALFIVIALACWQLHPILAK
jgi:uncharacterized protein